MASSINASVHVINNGQRRGAEPDRIDLAFPNEIVELKCPMIRRNSRAASRACARSRRAALPRPRSRRWPPSTHAQVPALAAVRSEHQVAAGAVATATLLGERLHLVWRQFSYDPLPPKGPTRSLTPPSRGRLLPGVVTRRSRTQTGACGQVIFAMSEIYTTMSDSSGWEVAERVGFEPTVSLHPQRFSRPSRSTTLAPLRRGQHGQWPGRTRAYRRGAGALPMPFTKPLRALYVVDA